MKAPTIYDVATQAGVSISTVSLALNKPDRVRADTRARIMEAIDDLGFVPRIDAVSRARQGVQRIGVIGPFTSYPSFARRLNGVLATAREEHFEVVVYDEQSAAMSRLGNLPLTRRVDGVILMSLPFSDDVARRLSEGRLAVVLVDLRSPRFSSVTIDDVAGGRIVGELFAHHGHEDVAFLGHAQAVEYESPSQLRLDGLRETSVKPPLARLVEHRFDAAVAGARELLAADQRPSAIFGYDDVLAAGALRAAHELGLRVPADLEIVGFDDGDFAAALDLTTVRQPFEEFGAVATEMLVAQIANPGRPVRSTTLGLELVERGSTRR